MLDVQSMSDEDFAALVRCEDLGISVEQVLLKANRESATANCHLCGQPKHEGLCRSEYLDFADVYRMQDRGFVFHP
jgi:hypothetical protein